MSYFNYKNKKIYYEIQGEGKPIVFLHGDAVSSKMFEFLIPLYKDCFQMIFIDFLGYGQSDRVEILPSDLWYQNALQVIALIEHLHYNKVNLIGTSGGAWVAMNVTLKRPDLVDRVIADSFDGRTLHDNFVEELLIERSQAMTDKNACLFYEWCLGDDWENTVKKDTDALIRQAHENKPLFYKSLTVLKNPILLTGSCEDSMIRKDVEDEYKEMMKLLENGKMHLFERGDHPAILSNAEEFFELVINFIK